MTISVLNDVFSPELNVISLTDRENVEFYIKNMGQQINESRNKMISGDQQTMRVTDLDQFISDIIIETTAQGASLLEVQIIDPGWRLLQRDQKTGACFFDVDDQGYLWPPVEVNFPPANSKTGYSGTGCVWRLAMLEPSTDLTGPNITLTFEDKIVSELREHSATPAHPKVASKGETRAEFIQSLATFLRQAWTFSESFGSTARFRVMSEYEILSGRMCSYE